MWAAESWWEGKPSTSPGDEWFYCTLQTLPWDEVGLHAALRSSKVESDSEEDQAKPI